MLLTGSVCMYEIGDSDSFETVVFEDQAYFN